MHLLLSHIFGGVAFAITVTLWLGLCELSFLLSEYFVESLIEYRKLE